MSPTLLRCNQLQNALSKFDHFVDLFTELSSPRIILGGEDDLEEEGPWTRAARRQLYKARNEDQESPLHTVRY